MISKKRLAKKWKQLPADAVESATIVPLGGASGTAEYNASGAVTVGAAEFRPVGKKSESLVGDVEIEVERKVVHLWVDTFSASHVVSEGEKITRPKDSTEWMIVSADLEMMDTRWRCACVKVIPAPS